MELRALGPVGAVVGGELVDLGPPNQRALFALLLSRVDRPVAVDTLIEELWSGEPPAAAMASLLAYVCNLRRVLEPHRPPRAPAAVLCTRAPGYVLDSRGVWAALAGPGPRRPHPGPAAAPSRHQPGLTSGRWPNG